MSELFFSSPHHISSNWIKVLELQLCFEAIFNAYTMWTNEQPENEQTKETNENMN